MTNPIGPKPRIPDDVGVTVGTTASPTGSKRRSAVLHILSPHTVRRTVALLALATVAAMATGVVAPGVAQAATCKTRAHAYVTQPGRIYLAGYEGDTSLGIPTWRTFPGDTFQIGGNGIQPGTTIHFIAVDAVGNQVDFGLSDSLPAGENCAANEGPTYRVVAPQGSYRIIAVYTGGNTGATHVQQVVDAIVEDVPSPVDPGWPPEMIYI